MRACADPNFPPHGTPETAVPVTLVNERATLDVVVCDQATEYFQVTVPAHRGLRVSWTVEPSGNAYVLAFPPNGAAWTTLGPGTLETSNPGITQPFLVQVENTRDVKADVTLNFSLVPEFCRPDDRGNTTEATAEPLELYGNYVHSHCLGVPDYFRFVASLDGEARITLEHDASLEPLGFSVFVMGDATSPVATSGPAPNGTTAAFVVVPGTTYVIRVADAPGATVAGRPFSVIVDGDTRCSSDNGEPDDTPPRAREITLVAASGVACGSNPDHWWFRAPATGLVNLHVRPNEVGTPLDLAAMAPNGTPIPFTVTPEAGGMDLSFNVTTGIVYVIRVQNVPGHLNTLYSLTESGPVYCREEQTEPNDTIATASAVGSLGSGGCSCNGNPDYFSVVPRNSGDAVVKVCGLFVSHLLDLEIQDEGGNTVPTTELDGGCPTRGFSAVAGSRYAARVSKPPGGYTDCYTIDLDGHAFCDDDAFEPNDTHQTATPFTSAPFHACGNNPDYVTFDVPVTGRAGLMLEAQFLVTPLVAAIEDGTGATLDATRVPYGSGSSDRFEVQWDAVAGPHAVRVTGPRDSSLFYQLRLLPPVPNDLCINAIEISPGNSVTGTTQGARNDLQFNATSCTGFPAVGPEVFYRVTVPSGAQLDAQLYTSGGDLSLALLDSCQSNCCWAGSDRAGPEENLSYLNATAQDQELILVVDGYSPYPAPFSLRTTVTP